ncbi:caspase domain-containing protein [Streptacidiphilus sp. MAP5-3]|uniref:caspase family protein n=1 Tax=unclassified Streptacidiphilus TaxID=2643834 RepID=UPI003513099B
MPEASGRIDSIDYARSRAILIGVADYDDAGFLPVPAAANSLNAMHTMLTDSASGAWPEPRVSVFRNPRNTGAFAAHLAELAKSAEDTLFFYFVGHGCLSTMSELCLTLSDTVKRHADLTGLPYRAVKNNILGNSAARLKAVVLDCCFSGQAIESLSGDVIDSLIARGTTIITAADHDQAAHVVPTSEQAQACTSFTRHLLDIVEVGRPHGTEMLTLQEIYPLLQNRLREYGLPEPNQRTTDTAGFFPLARNRALAPLADRESASTEAAPGVGERYALVVWRKSRALLDDPTGRWYGETQRGEQAQEEADRMWWPIARWRIPNLKSLVVVTDGRVHRIREVFGVDEETTSAGDNGKLALRVSAPLEPERLADRLPGLPFALDDAHPAVQGRMREYVTF